jgi:hypothetical protein
VPGQLDVRFGEGISLAAVHLQAFERQASDQSAVFANACQYDDDAAQLLVKQTISICLARVMASQLTISMQLVVAGQVLLLPD